MTNGCSAPGSPGLLCLSREGRCRTGAPHTILTHNLETVALVMVISYLTLPNTIQWGSLETGNEKGALFSKHSLQIPILTMQN